MKPKERPILFSTQLVQAILEGRKTMTRRVVKPQPDEGEKICRCHWVETGWSYENANGGCRCIPVKCPYGSIGDILWVRETWVSEMVNVKVDGKWAPVKRFYFKADGDPNEKPFFDKVKWRPSIFMPRTACRIRLEITDIKVERLHDISEEDAAKEGIEPISEVLFKDYKNTWLADGWGTHASMSFQSLWQSINGPESWDANPWVFVITFKKL